MSSFLGINVKANESKTNEIPDGFALVLRSMSLVKGKKRVVSASIDGTKYVFCTLIEGVFPQHSFNIAFYPGCKLELMVESEDSEATVNFVGAFESLDSGMDFYDDEDEDMDDFDDEDDDDEEDEDDEDEEEDEEEEEEEEKKPVKAEKRKKEEKKVAAAEEFKCKKCERVFKTKQSMEQHMSSKHK